MSNSLATAARLRLDTGVVLIKEVEELGSYSLPALIFLLLFLR